MRRGIRTGVISATMAAALVLSACAPPVTPPTAPVAYAAVDAGTASTCGLTTTGAVRCWGDNGSGQLGDGTTTDRPVPVPVTGLGTGVTELTVGDAHACAVHAGGTVSCWGANGSGQLGDGTSGNARPTPVPVVGLPPGIVDIGTGRFHTCALAADGTVWCWGMGAEGALGNGATEDSPQPVEVTGLGPVASISVGVGYACAVTTSGGARCWGYNWQGMLGDGTRTSQSLPVDVVGLTSGVMSVHAGDLHTCAVTDAGTAMCWGANIYGQLGTGTVDQRSTVPVDVVGLDSAVTSVSAEGDGHTCAVTAGGAVWCWGYAHVGQLGADTLTTTPVPQPVSGLGADVTSISAHGWHSCATTDDGAARCWGGNGSGQLGDGTTTDRPVPVRVVDSPPPPPGPAGPFESLDVGSGHTCAVTAAGALQCWGGNFGGQLGDGTTVHRVNPTTVIGMGSGVAAVSAGLQHTCALSTQGGVSCWGSNSEGQLGDGTTVDRSVPQAVPGLVGGVVAISAGGFNTCALTSAGGVKCWGSSVAVGFATDQDQLVPTDVPGLTTGVSAVSVGSGHACALTDGGGVQCWGADYWGELGDGSNYLTWGGDQTAAVRPAPVDVVGLTSGATAIDAGVDHTCAIVATGAKCWGRAHSGAVGDGTAVPSRPTPTDVVGLSSGVATVSAGSFFACALGTDGGASCWGQNDTGKVGNGTSTNQLVPGDVVGLGDSGSEAVVAGGSHACALLVDGRVACWGQNYYGQLGDGRTYQMSTVPVQVVTA